MIYEFIFQFFPTYSPILVTIVAMLIPGFILCISYYKVFTCKNRIAIAIFGIIAIASFIFCLGFPIRGLQLYTDKYEKCMDFPEYSYVYGELREVYNVLCSSRVHIDDEWGPWEYQFSTFKDNVFRINGDYTNVNP